MRADRLVSILLLLNANGPMIADDLAERLEVSTRTIYRDIDALSMAGIPVYAQGGRNGGLYLDESYRVSLNGLRAEEVRSLFISGMAGPLSDLGLERPLEEALLKLHAGLPQRDQEHAARMRQRVLIDPHGWFSRNDKDTVVYLALLFDAVYQSQKVAVIYQRADGTESERVLSPLGLVAKANNWYCVACVDGAPNAEGPRVYRASRFQQVRLLDATFAHPPHFDLQAYWEEKSTGFETGLKRYIARIRGTRQTARASTFFPADLMRQVTEFDADGRAEFEIIAPTHVEAVTLLLALGIDVEILSPPELAGQVREAAQALVDKYADQ